MSAEFKPIRGFSGYVCNHEGQVVFIDPKTKKETFLTCHSGRYNVRADNGKRCTITKVRAACLAFVGAPPTKKSRACRSRDNTLLWSEGQPKGSLLRKNLKAFIESPFQDTQLQELLIQALEKTSVHQNSN